MQFLEKDSNYKLFLVSFASVVFHVLFLSLFKVNSPSKLKLIEVSFIPKEELNEFQKLQKPQIVSDSASENKPPLQDTNLRSSKDSSADVEQIKRGLTSTPKPQVQNQKSQPAKASEQKINTQKAAPKLLLSQADINTTLNSKNGELLAKSPAQKKEKNADTRVNEFKQATPFVPYKATSSESLAVGVPDYLPNIKDGDITLLNAKADIHAVFVRRVALQVFGELRKTSWTSLSRSNILQISDYVMVEGVMNLKGELLGAKLQTSSGSDAFDKALLDSVQQGLWDQNPPPAAKSDDGNIHFVFQARTWSSPGRPPVGERRWLRLGTGLL